MTDFRPKGHIALTAALQRAGSTIVERWTGDEIKPEIWFTDTSLKFFEERKSFIASEISEAAYKEWGDRWINAVTRWLDALSDTEKLAMADRHRDQIDALARNLGSKGKAWGAIALTEGALCLLHRANLKHNSLLSGLPPGKDGSAVPMIDMGGTLEEIEIDRETLLGYQKAADEHFGKINQSKIGRTSKVAGSCRLVPPGVSRGHARLLLRGERRFPGDPGVAHFW